MHVKGQEHEFSQQSETVAKENSTAIEFFRHKQCYGEERKGIYSSLSHTGMFILDSPLYTKFYSILGRLSQLQENARRTKIIGSQLCQFAYNTKSLLIDYPPFVLLRCVLYIELKIKPSHP